MTSTGILAASNDSIDSLLEDRCWNADMQSKIGLGLIKEEPYSDVIWDIILHKVEKVETTAFIRYDSYTRQLKRGLDRMKVYRPAHWTKEKIKSVLPELTNLEHMFLNGFGASLSASFVVSYVADYLGFDNAFKNELSFWTELAVNSLTVGKQFYEVGRRSGLTIRQIIGDGLGYLAPFTTLANYFVYQNLKTDTTNILVDKVGMDFPPATVSSQILSFFPYAILINAAMNSVYGFQQAFALWDEKRNFSKFLNTTGRVIDNVVGFRKLFRKVRNATSETVDFIYEKFSDENLEKYRDYTLKVIKEKEGFRSYAKSIRELYDNTLGNIRRDM